MKYSTNTVIRKLAEIQINIHYFFRIVQNYICDSFKENMNDSKFSNNNYEFMMINSLVTLKIGLKNPFQYLAFNLFIQFLIRGADNSL